ncbi:DUF1007 family protein [Psychromonas sp. KJ10-2]|uniref:DUF1007 family protein n=1 Tax=Psychromonas sp. KJ10-2 TaxID=3391822 RepID=UPI0039B36662
MPRFSKLIKGNWLLLITCLLLSTLPSRLSAHPHAWVATNTYIESDDTHIIALHMTWTFDADTSDYMLQGEDISPEHLQQTLQKLAVGVIDNMYNEHYFTYLYNDTTPVKYKSAIHPQMVKDKNKIVLSFELPLSNPIAFAGKNLRLYIYDQTYFVDMSWLNKGDVQISAALNSACAGEIIEPKVSDAQRAFTLALAADVTPDNTLGRYFSQQYKLDCQ